MQNRQDQQKIEQAKAQVKQLSGKFLSEQESILSLLESAVCEVTGQTFLPGLSEQQYVDEMRSLLESIILKMPGYVYLKDKNFKYLFCNERAIEFLELSSLKDFIGKTDYDFGWDKAVVDAYRKVDEEIFKTGQPKLGFEEIIYTNQGEPRFLHVNKIPLFNKMGDVIGIIGISIDITAQKEAERLLLESERQRHQIILQEKENFAMLARKVAHDINSPLAALNMMLDVCNELPEDKRSFLRRATESILDIANNLLSNADKEESAANVDIEFREPLLVSDLLVHLLSEKKVQYQHYPMSFETVIVNDAQFAFIQMQKTEFRRAMSNLINNAVDALEDKENDAITHGTVTVQLNADAGFVTVKVQDNGKGMPRDKVEKILNRQSFTEGKENGHGIGLQQVWDMLECNQGTMTVQSRPGKGTTIQLTFPRVAASNWIAQEIHLAHDDIIVILDDDASVRQVSRRNNYFALKRDDKVRCAVNGSLLTQARRVTAWSEAVGTT